MEKSDLEITKKALALGWITMAQLKSCFEYQRKCQEKGEGVSLSQILLRQKYLTPAQIEFLANGPQDRQEGFGLKVGTTFEGYLIQERLGAGGMGIVYRAIDIKLKREVALKLLLSLDVTPEESRRFLQEASVMARLDHPNIIRIFDARDIPRHYFVMECVSGNTLSHLIKEKKTHPIFVAQIIQKIAEALDAVHSLEIVHRDIKPSNIMVSQEGVPKLMDFGLARIENIENSLSKTGNVVGTPAYMPPEQAEGKKADGRSDIYSLGATFYECLTGRPPFQGESYIQIVQQILSSDAVLPRVLNPDIPTELEAIILKCLEKKSRRRYVNAKQMARDIRNFLANRPIVARRCTRSYLLKKFILRHKVLTSALVSAVLLLSVFISTLLYYNERVTREKTEALRTKAQLAEEKSESEALAKAVIASLHYAYAKDVNLQKDPQFLAPLREIFKHLKRFKAGDEYRSLRGIVFGMSESLSESNEGIEEYDRMIQKDPKNAMLYANRATFLSGQGRNEEALRDYDRAIALDPKLALSYSNRGLFYARQKRYAEALRDYDQALSLDPKLVLGYYNRGEWYEIHGRHEEALRDLSQAIALNPKFGAAYLKRGDIYQVLGKDEEAIRDYTQAIFYCPSDLYSYNNRGNLYSKQGKYEEALNDYTRAISLDPKLGVGYLNRGAVFYKLGKDAEAEADFTRAISLDPKLAFAYHFRGDIYQKQGKIEQALKDYDQGITLDPSYADTYANRGLIYGNQEKYEKAISDWKKAIALGHERKQELIQFIAKAKKMAPKR